MASAIKAVFGADTRQLRAEMARAEALAIGFSQRTQRAFEASQAASLVKIKAQMGSLAAFNMAVAAQAGRGMMSENKSGAKDEAVRVAEVEAVARSNAARRLWRQRKADRTAEAEEIAQLETAAQVEAATRANRARYLLRMRAAEREARGAAEIEAISDAARGYGLGIGGEGAHGSSGIIRESLVIVRELARGNFTRVAGSVTLLAQYFGLLGKVVKSTAQEEVKAAAAGAKLAQSMSATALAAEAKAAATVEAGMASGLSRAASLQAAEADLTAAAAARTNALAQILKANSLKAAAEVALASATASMGPIGWILIAGVAITAALAGVVWHLHKVAVGVKNFSELMDPLKTKFTDQADAMRDAAKAHQEYLDYLQKIGDETESLPEKIDKIIRKLREETAAEIELARAKGATNQDIQGMQVDQLQKELEITAIAKLQAGREAEQAAMDRDAAAAALETGKLDNATVRGVKNQASTAGAVLDAAQEAMDSTKITTGGEITGGSSISGYTRTPFDVRQANENDQLTFKVGDKKYTTSVAAAKAAFNRLTASSDALEAAQQQLADKLRDTKTTAEEKRKAYDKLAAAQKDYETQLAIASTTGAETAKAEDDKDKSNQSNGRISDLNQQQRIGAYATEPDWTRVHTDLLQKIEKNTGSVRPNPQAAPGSRPPQHGTMPNR